MANRKPSASILAASIIAMAIIAATTLTQPVVAFAQYPTPPPVLVRGRAELRNAQVHVGCDHEDAESADCWLSTSGTLVALEDGVEARATRDAPVQRLELGQRMRVDARTWSDLRVRRDFFTLLGHAPLGARHPWLGESWLQYNRSPDVHLSSLAGDDLHFIDPQTASHDLRHVEATHDPDRPGVLRLRMRSPHGAPPEGPLAHGGPAVTLGGALQGDTATLGLGYEVGLFDYLIASAWFETNFESVREVLLIEAALPGAAVIWPSLAAGVGIVAQQAGGNDPQGALRIRLTASSIVIGVLADFDYRPVTGDWTVTVMGRAGI